MKYVTLPVDVAVYLYDLVEFYDDEGPPHEGWQSDRLSAALATFARAIKEAK